MEHPSGMSARLSKTKKNTGDVSGSPFDPLYLHQSELRVQQMHRRETFGLRACF